MHVPCGKIHKGLQPVPGETTLCGQTSTQAHCWHYTHHACAAALTEAGIAVYSMHQHFTLIFLYVPLSVHNVLAACLHVCQHLSQLV